MYDLFDLINFDTKFFIEYTKSYLDLKLYMDRIVVDCFENDINFQNQRDNGFKQVLNQFDKTPGFLATYLDFQFVKGNKGARNMGSIRNRFKKALD